MEGVLCHVHCTDIPQDREDYNSKVVLFVGVQVAYMGTDSDLVDAVVVDAVVVVAANGMHYSEVVVLVDGDSYYHGAVLGAQKNFHGVQEDGKVRQVVEAAVEAAVAADASGLDALHTQKYRAVEAGMEPHKDPCCLDYLQ